LARRRHRHAQGERYFPVQSLAPLVGQVAVPGPAGVREVVAADLLPDHPEPRRARPSLDRGEPAQDAVELVVARPGAAPLGPAHPRQARGQPRAGGAAIPLPAIGEPSQARVARRPCLVPCLVLLPPPAHHTPSTHIAPDLETMILKIAMIE